MTSSEQARADAMADAETLQLFDRSGGPNGLPGGVGCMAGIAIYSERAVHAMRSGSISASWRNAEKSARYAFLAVPALRGEKCCRYGHARGGDPVWCHMGHKIVPALRGDR